MNTTNLLQDFVAGLLIVSVALLSCISVLGVWGIFGDQVISKSFMTLGLVVAASIIVSIAARFIDRRAVVQDTVPPGAPAFKLIRQFVLLLLIALAALLALVGVLSIWEVIKDQAVVFKSLASLSIVAFSSFIIVLTCLDRERSPLWKLHGRSMSGGAVLLFLILVWLFLSRFL